MKNPKYTFLLPAYKGRFLDEMLRSIQSQIYKDFKVIISDDCSPEDLYSICKPYLEDARFSYRRNEKNMGGEDLVTHWNLLVDMCETDYLIMASDDDVYDVSFLEKIDAQIKKFPLVDVFRARVRKINEEGEICQKDPVYEEYQNQLECIYEMYLCAQIRCIANHVFRTKTIKEKKGFVSFPLAWYSDTATIILLSEKGIVNTADILFGFRVSSIHLSSQIISPEVSNRKLCATLQYAEWFGKMILPQLPNVSKLDVYMFNYIRTHFIQDIRSQSLSNIWFLDSLQYYNAITKLKNAGVFLRRLHILSFSLEYFKKRLYYFFVIKTLNIMKKN